MTHDPRFPDEDFEDEPIEVEVRRPVGMVYEIRFSGEEADELLEERRYTDLNTIEMIREYALEVVRTKRRAREAGQAEVAD